MRLAYILPSADPFPLFPVATGRAASLFPVQGAVAAWAGAIADPVMALLFFMQGAKLSHGDRRRDRQFVAAPVDIRVDPFLVSGDRAAPDGGRLT